MSVKVSAGWFRHQSNNLMRFFSSNAATLIALSSLIIAGAALVYTIAAQREDLFYREVLIRPTLNWHVDLEKFTVRLSNDGPGPAVIKRVAWRNANDCYDADVTDPATWQRKREAFEQFLNLYFLDEIAETTGAMKTLGVRPATYAAVPTPSAIVAPGKDIEVFGIANFEEFRRTLRTMPPAVGGNFNQEFAHRASILPLVAGYCSITGRFCATSIVLGMKLGDCK